MKMRLKIFDLLLGLITPFLNAPPHVKLLDLKVVFFFSIFYSTNIINA